MITPGALIVIDERDPVLMDLEAKDLEHLLELRPSERLGYIMELNQTPRYHYRLNAFVLLDRLAEFTKHHRPEGEGRA